jgi:hypothetical protein
MNDVLLTVPILFSEIDNLDKNIAKKIGDVIKVITDFSKQKPVVIKCNIHLPPDDVFRLTGIQYAFYIITKDEKGATIVTGMRTERHHAEGGGVVARLAIMAAIQAFTESSSIHDLNFRLVSDEEPDRHPC